MMDHPLCPFGVRGVDSFAMAACPGYLPEDTPIGLGSVVRRGVSCHHLASQSNRRGRFTAAWVSACLHPEGLPVDPGDAAALLQMIDEGCGTAGAPISDRREDQTAPTR